MGRDNHTNLTFWEHLDELRGCIIRVLAVSMLFGILAFLFKDEVFCFVFAPKETDFVTYRLLGRITDMLGFSDLWEQMLGVQESGADALTAVRLINTELTSQFLVHVKMAFCIGLLCASPYIIYVLFRFVSPGLYEKERILVSRILVFGFILFAVGFFFSYYVVFPFTYRFLGNYNVSPEVSNMISLDSYVDTFLALGLALGLVFELPVLCFLLSRVGVLSSGWMIRYRRHAIVFVLVLAAILTPTSDVFTLLLVSLPMYILYELSIVVVRLFR
ncbi:MAG: twin-arginine translocase subunit TatC [Bacteroides sp.]|nr:twin-arginine translocase subunit TatC [Roseburia sp.]MCM1347641.1 twin-arginine translocase subunit TatC [Bacteroides sp.]MCM1422080.1 twin-arginine translocase subunit TatC [Bacteroides sp.]